MSKHFSEDMEAEFTSKQCTDLWSRIKERLNKNHVSGLSKFKKDCSKTGGGPSPTPPPLMDGDDYCHPIKENFHTETISTKASH